MQDEHADGARGSDLDPEAIARIRRLDPDGQSGLLARLLRTYLDALARELDRITLALDGGALEEAAQRAHTLKSSSASVGASAVASAAAELEQAVRSAPPAALAVCREGLERASRRVGPQLQALLEREPCD